MTRTARTTLALLVLAATGCGSGGGEGGPGSTQPADVDANQRELDKQIAYDFCIDTCSNYTLKVAASVYGVRPEPEAVADEVAQNAEDAGSRAETRRGCLDAFKK